MDSRAAVTIEARAVLVGDELWHHHGGSGPDKFGHRRLPESGWHVVKAVRTDGGTTWIECRAWTTAKHPREGVTVRRGVPA